jgi:hypothetical protein
VLNMMTEALASHSNVIVGAFNPIVEKRLFTDLSGHFASHYARLVPRLTARKLESYNGIARSRVRRSEPIVDVSSGVSGTIRKISCVGREVLVAPGSVKDEPASGPGCNP